MRTTTRQVPFWTFFGATVIGKALIKMHAQMLLEVCAAHLVRSFFFWPMFGCVGYVCLCLTVFGCVQHLASLGYHVICLDRRSPPDSLSSRSTDSDRCPNH